MSSQMDDGRSLLNMEAAEHFLLKLQWKLLQMFGMKRK